MPEHVFRMPDVGEGVAEAEIVGWLVAIGEEVEVDQAIVEIMTDKATVEVSSPVAGTVLALGGEPGDIVAVGADLIRFAAAGDGGTPEPEPEPAAVVSEAPAESPEVEVQAASPPPVAPVAPVPPTTRAVKVVASPAVRARALEGGVDLADVAGSGPAGRVTQGDLDGWLEQPTRRGAGARPDGTVTDVKIIGLRRQIAKQMTLAKQHIPHITYVEEIDVTAVEGLRAKLNAARADGQPKLTLLPFIMRAVARAVAAHPAVNARFDDDAGVLHQYAGVHIGIATQTDAGLVVPVVRHAETLDLWQSAAEVQRLAAAARDGGATRGELGGSTITITSLGALGGIVTTPVINYPEVAIIGVNKVQVRPVWDGATFVPRSIMNLSSGFDHRIVDGWEAASFVQRIKSSMEEPALLFIEGA